MDDVDQVAVTDEDLVSEPEVGRGRVAAVLITRENPLAVALIPRVLERVTRFAAVYDQAADAGAYRAAIWRSIGNGDSSCLVVAYVNGYAGVVGHLLAVVGQVVTGRFGMILQWEKDPGIPRDPEPDRQVMQLIEGWATTMKLGRVSAIAADEGRATAFRRKGFVPVGVFVTRGLSNG